MQAKADKQKKRLLTFTIETDVGFDAPEDLERFSTALADAVATLTARFTSAAPSRRYRVVIGGHPAPPQVSRLTGGAAIMNPPQLLIVELIVAAPIDVVWNALRDRAAITQWFGWNHPGLPEEIEYIFQTHAVADDAARRLVINTDEMTLEAHGGRTIVRVTRAAPVRGTWDDIYDEIAEGWRTFIQLGCRGHARGGTPAGGRSRRGHGRWSSSACRSSPTRARATRTRCTPRSAIACRATCGSARGGNGLTVHEFSDGLLVAMLRPETDKSPFGGGMCVLTLYGFDQARHEAMTAKWRAWFEANFDKVEVQV